MDALEMAISMIRNRISYAKVEEPKEEETIIERILKRTKEAEHKDEIII